MSSKGRTNWRQRAEQAEQRIAELEKAADEWKSLASVWRSQLHALQDVMARGEAQNITSTSNASTVEEPEVEDDVVQ